MHKCKIRIQLWSDICFNQSMCRQDQDKSLVPMGVLIGFILFMSNILNMTRVYFVWLMKVFLFGLFDLKLKKECENFHHRYFKPIGHDFSKLFIKWFVSRKKIISLTYIKHTNKSFSIFLVKRVESTLSIIKSFPTRISIRHSYHALGVYLSL
jgi:hypothetical protein